MQVEKRMNMRGGKGEIIIEHLIDESVRGKNVRMFAKITVAPGCSIGYHEHVGERETYYIAEGEGVYDDNGQKRTVKKGDVTVTPSNKGHAIENSGENPLILIALIILD